MSGIAVLVAEDEALARMALRAQLEALDYRVLAVAANGEEATALGACLPVELAIFDVRMPVLNGLDAAETVFRHAPTPVLLLSGVGAADLPDPIPRPPIFATITKPVGLQELRQALLDARDAFEQWAGDNGGRRERVRRGLEERTVIARFLETSDDMPARTAVQLLRRAEAEGRGILDLVRDTREPEG